MEIRSLTEANRLYRQYLDRDINKDGIIDFLDNPTPLAQLYNRRLNVYFNNYLDQPFDIEANSVYRLLSSIDITNNYDINPQEWSLYQAKQNGNAAVAARIIKELLTTKEKQIKFGKAENENYVLELKGQQVTYYLENAANTKNTFDLKALPEIKDKLLSNLLNELKIIDVSYKNYIQSYFDIPPNTIEETPAYVNIKAAEANFVLEKKQMELAHAKEKHINPKAADLKYLVSCLNLASTQNGFYSAKGSLLNNNEQIFFQLFNENKSLKISLDPELTNSLVIPKYSQNTAEVTLGATKYRENELASMINKKLRNNIFLYNKQKLKYITDLFYQSVYLGHYYLSTYQLEQKPMSIAFAINEKINIPAKFQNILDFKPDAGGSEGVLAIDYINLPEDTQTYNELLLISNNNIYQQLLAAAYICKQDLTELNICAKKFDKLFARTAPPKSFLELNIRQADYQKYYTLDDDPSKMETYGQTKQRLKELLDTGKITLEEVPRFLHTFFNDRFSYVVTPESKNKLFSPSKFFQSGGGVCDEWSWTFVNLLQSVNFPASKYFLVEGHIKNYYPHMAAVFQDRNNKWYIFEPNGIDLRNPFSTREQVYQHYNIIMDKLYISDPQDHHSQDIPTQNPAALFFTDTAGSKIKFSPYEKPLTFNSGYIHFDN